MCLWGVSPNRDTVASLAGPARLTQDPTPSDAAFSLSMLVHRLRRLPSARLSHKGREREGVAAVLDTEDAQQEAVEEEHDADPGDGGDELLLGLGDARNARPEGNGGKGQQAVWCNACQRE